jgi:ppGpp synthetase/RelA/SpoT-type nucleotidyltranferase
MAPTIQETDRDWACLQIEEYRNVFPRYASCARVLQQVLEKASRMHAPLAIVQTRPKAIASFAEKAQRKKGKYRDPLIRMTDLCGARVITQTLSEVKAVSEFIEKHFAVDWGNSIDVSQRLKASEFGYRSVHYVVQFKRGIFPSEDIDVSIPDETLPDPSCPMKAEIQVRTLLEHAWAGFAHDRVYKSEFAIPEKWQRELAGVAAMFEGADEAFARIQAGLQVYTTSYGAFMSAEQMQKEIEILETVLDCEPQNAPVAHRIGKLAMTRGDWQKAIDVFSRYVASRYQPILRDLGVALCQLHAKDPNSEEYRKGQKYLEAASAPPNRDVDALASLAGSWKSIDEEKARALYRQAFEVDPTDPYAVSNYLVYEIVYRRDIAPVALMAPAITAAMRRCRDQAEVGMNLPWAYYNLGIFHLLLDQPYESLAAYSKAVQLSTNSWMIETSLRLLNRLGVVRNVLKGYEWIRRLLLVSHAVKFPSDVALEHVKKLALTEAEPIVGPVVIVAGAGDENLERQLQPYRRLLIEAFREFSGTIISGGTTAGISGIVGDVQQEYANTIQTIGYVPRLIPTGVNIDSRYSSIRKTDGNDFSAIEPLQYWIDLIASGILPSQVRLLGIGGGIVSAAEYRLALALGARVAMVEGSGSEVARFVPEDNWGSSDLLLRLPADAMTLRAFVGSGTPKLESTMRETIARTAHETYRKAQISRKPNSDVSLVEWEVLPSNLKESNRNQADNIVGKLRQIGCTVYAVEGGEPARFKFSDSEIEIMAEMEHGRWVVERLEDGWKWGAERDIAKKTSPYLLSWAQLPDNVKEWDRESVRTIPNVLAEVGIEIRRNKSPAG